MKRDSPVGNNPAIDILIPMFNGGNFIEEQLLSILDQKEASTTILIKDDGSTDNSLAKVKAIKHPEKYKVKVLSDGSKKMGLNESLNQLFENASGEYSCVSDQDDVWIKEKTALCLDAMRKLEQRHGTKTPILIHTDLTVASTDLATIHSSFMAYRKLDPEKSHLNYLLVQNNVTGCTMMINKALREKAMPIPKSACVHDWWIALVACLTGVTEFVNHPTVLYRQHERNQIGARKYTIPYMTKRLLSYSTLKSDIAAAIKQAEVLYERYAMELPSQKKNQLRSFIALRQMPFLQRKLQIFKNGFYKQDFWRTLGFVALA